MEVRWAIAAGVVLLGVLPACVAMLMQPWVTPIVTKTPVPDPERLAAHVRRLSIDFYPRSFDRYENLERTADYVRDQFRASGAQVFEQRYRVDESEFRNIVARFGPQDGPLLVIGAHYDSHGHASEGATHARGYSLQTHTPGADDNASGVAGLLELARLLARHPPKGPVELVAYTLEEPPHFRTDHMGSVWHAKRLRAQGRPVALMVALEMIGYFRDDEGSQAFPVPALRWLYPTRGNYIVVAGRLGDALWTRRVKASILGASSLPVESISAPRLLPGLDFSDHQSYWNEGFAAVMVTDTAFLRNQNYHLSGDTHEKLDYARMAQVVQGVLALAMNH